MRNHTYITLAAITLAAGALLTACGSQSSNTSAPAADTKTDVMTETATPHTKHVKKLASILDNQGDKVKTRYNARHPRKTLEFFGVTPGMTVAEALPGRGWYTKILTPYLGQDGHIIGVDYDHKMWSEFGGFADAEFIEARKTWSSDWVKETSEWRLDTDAKMSAFTFGNRNTDMDGKIDAVLFIRALHNLSRFEEKGGYMSTAIADTYAMLKPGGIVGIVQHESPIGNDDDWANGSNGYLKKAAVIAAFEAAGFVLDGESSINANPKDTPTTDDKVWRLPPSLRASKDNPERKAKMKAIGESHRMTLRFKKPS